MRRAVRLASVALPIGVALLVWAPQLRFDHVPGIRIAPDAVERARTLPADSVLDELRGLDMFPSVSLDSAGVVAVADRILRGRLELPDLPAAAVHSAFTPTDFDEIEPALRLRYAAFVVPDLLLAAHAVTGRETYFDAARDFILAWGAYERRAWRPKGYLWNDHATAARVRVLAEFWRQYRGRSDYDPAVGRSVLEQAARYREFLASRRHFTFSTNHGLMENLGLLQLEVGFPTLPAAAVYRATALERLDGQLAFLVDEHGVVRENSAGYQSFGLEILGQTFRCMTLLGVPVPAAWSERYRKGVVFLASLTRPDGTLPSYGDTDGAPQGWIPRETAIDALGRSAPLRPWTPTTPAGDVTLHVGAGYWIEWSGLDRWPEAEALAQTAVTWTSPPGPGHKHADEAGVLVWSRGVAWLTSVGYWPYDVPGRDDAEGWSASNAPHGVNEPSDSPRSSRLVATAASRSLSLIDLERHGPGGYVARRQTVFVKPNRWIVLDAVTSDGNGTATTWTMSPDVSLEETEWGAYRLRAPADTAELEILTSPGAAIHSFRGSLSPFAGWQVIRGSPREAPALVVEQGAGASWSAVVLTLPERTAEPGGPERSRVVALASPERWAIALTRGADSVLVRRNGALVVLSRAGSRREEADTLRLSAAPDPEPELEPIRAAYRASALAYPHFEDLAGTRAKATMLVLALFVAQEIVLLVRWLRPRWHLPLRVVSILGWIAVASWLHLALLRSYVVLTS